MAKHDETYVSLDIEADGPIPGRYSMLSLGAAAFRFDSATPRDPISTFSVNIKALPEATQCPRTMKEFWAENPEAWQACNVDPVEPKEAMLQLSRWLHTLPGHTTFVAFPATFDFMFLRWYWCAFGPFGEERQVGISALDIKTLAMAKMNKPFRRATKSHMPKSWFEGCPKHNHYALTDAIEQGIMFMNMAREV